VQQQHLLEEKDMLAANKCSNKIRNNFEKYHLGVGAVYSIFSDCVKREYNLYFPLCDSLFKTCRTETGYILALHNALRVFYGLCSTSEDGIQSKKTWIDHPELFMEQVQLKFGKPGVCSSEVYEQAVASNFEQLMNDNDKKTEGRVYTALDNAVLIRFRVLCFVKQKRANSKSANKLNKLKRKEELASMEEPATKKMSLIEAPTSVLRKEAPRFLKLLHSQDEGKLPATSDSSTRKDSFVKLVAAGPNPDTTMAVSQESTETNLPLQPDLDDDIGIEDDPGPFQLASPEKVAGFGPVLVIFPESGDIDIVLVEVSPLDVYYRERLRLDVHAMTYLTNVLSLKEMRRKGYNFQFYSAKKDCVSESFAVLRGISNRSVGTIMDEVLPASHSFSAHFKLLGHHGEYQEKRDDGNLTGGVGKGYRIDLGCCDHNYKGENSHGLGHTPRTNGGVKCFKKVTGNVEINSQREELRNYFGAQMDAIQLIVDQVRKDHGYPIIYNDSQRELANAAQLRHEK
jgi:hypothetical protein